MTNSADIAEAANMSRIVTMETRAQGSLEQQSFNMINRLVQLQDRIHNLAKSGTVARGEPKLVSCLHW
jgi:hypothetical protein